MNIRAAAIFALFALVFFSALACSSDPGEDDPDAGYNDVTVPDTDLDDADLEDADPGADTDADSPVELQLNSVAPDEGSVSGGETVTLGGQGFLDGMQVFFGDVETTEVTRQGGLSAEALTPPAAQEGPVDVTVENPDGATATITDAYTYIEEPEPDPAQIGYCQTEVDELTVAPDEETPAITGVVFVEDVTSGEGEGDGIDGRVLWGDDGEDFSDWDNTVDADYLEDADGLSDGDLANDRYTATLTVEDEGSYGFVFQFRVDDGDWVSCNTGGSEGADDFDPDETGQLTVEEATEPEVNRPEACNVQFPIIAESISLEDDDVVLYGRVFEPGMTDQADLPGDLVAEALIGSPGADPVDDEDSFVVVAGMRNDDYVGDDFEEFEAVVDLDAGGDAAEAIVEAGTYAYLFRISLDGGDHWTHCDASSVVDDESDIATERFGALTVFDESPERVHFCATWPEELSGADDADGPTMDMEVYEEEITDVPPPQIDGDLLEVQAGFGAPGTNPALGYNWTPLEFSGTVAGSPDNFEYAGPLYDEADAPAEGDYQAITRARITGEEAWRYCVVNPPDPYDEDADYFLFERSTSVSVETD